MNNNSSTHNMNLMHDVPAGTKEEMNVIIEIPRGCKNKYEINKELGIMELDRVLHSSQDYPFDYGFIPQTSWDDGDALDVIMLTTYPLVPGILVRARPIGIMRMNDSGENDDKVIAVPVDDPRFSETKNIDDVNKHTLKEIEHFFSTYKQLQNKNVEVTGFENKAVAQEAFDRSLTLYTEKYSK